VHNEIRGVTSLEMFLRSRLPLRCRCLLTLIFASLLLSFSQVQVRAWEFGTFASDAFHETQKYFSSKDKDEVYYVMNNFQFGVDRMNKGWFIFENEDGYIEEAYDLDHIPYLFGRTKNPLSHRSNTFQSHEAGRWISLVVHSNTHASLTVIDIDGSSARYISPVHHSGNHRNLTRRRLEQGQTSHSRHLMAVQASPWILNASCGALVEAMNISDDDDSDNDNPNDNLDFYEPSKKPKKIKEIKIEDKSKSNSVKPMDPERHSSAQHECKAQCKEECTVEGKGQCKRECMQECIKQECREQCKEECKGKGNEKGECKRECRENCEQGSKHRELAIKPWQGCYESQDTARVMEIGLMVDYGFYVSYGEDLVLTMEAIEVILANTNLVMSFQLNVWIRARQIVVVTDPPGNIAAQAIPDIEDVLSQNPATDSCHYNILKALDSLRSLSATMTVQDLNAIPTLPQTYNETNGEVSEFYQLSHWHLLSDCYPAECDEASCTVGIAYTRNSFPKSTICKGNSNGGNNVAVTSRNQRTWLIFIHEMAHNIGSSHSFENGVGSTGGIMDYDNNRYEGEFQFNEQYRRAEICQEMNELVVSDVCNQGIANLFPTISTDCVGKADRVRCFPGDIGMCLNETCLAIELQLVISNNSVIPDPIEVYGVEVSEFGPVSPYSEQVGGELVVAKADSQEHPPDMLCTPTSQNLTGKIAFIERGECTFKLKAENARAAGAIAVIVHNNVPGYASAMSGDGFSIPTIQVTFDDGNAVLVGLQSRNHSFAYIGGFPARDLPTSFIAARPVPKEEEKRGLREHLIVAFSSLLGLCVIYLVYDIYREKYIDTRSVDEYDDDEENDHAEDVSPVVVPVDDDEEKKFYDSDTGSSKKTLVRARWSMFKNLTFAPCPDQSASIEASEDAESESTKCQPSEQLETRNTASKPSKRSRTRRGGSALEKLEEWLDDDVEKNPNRAQKNA